MIKVLFFILLFISVSAKSEIVIELSNKKLPIFNMPLLKENENLYLIEKDPINNITYVAHKTCFTFTIFALTSNKNIFLNENDIQNLIETSHDYADIFCPTTNKVVLIASNTPDFENHEIMFQTSLVRQDNWIEEKEQRKNNILQKEIDRVKKLQSQLEGKNKIERLAFMIGANSLDNLPKISLESSFSDKQKINAMILITGIKKGYTTSSYPIDANVYGLPEKTGYYLISGNLSSEKSTSDKKLLDTKIYIDNFIECKKKGCSDLYDIDSIIRNSGK